MCTTYPFYSNLTNKHAANGQQQMHAHPRHVETYSFVENTTALRNMNGPKRKRPPPLTQALICYNNLSL